jgi:hypothetical protein
MDLRPLNRGAIKTLQSLSLQPKSAFDSLCKLQSLLKEEHCLKEHCNPFI